MSDVAKMAQDWPVAAWLPAAVPDRCVVCRDNPILSLALCGGCQVTHCLICFLPRSVPGCCAGIHAGMQPTIADSEPQ